MKKLSIISLTIMLVGSYNQILYGGKKHHEYTMHVHNLSNEVIKVQAFGANEDTKSVQPTSISPNSFADIIYKTNTERDHYVQYFYINNSIDLNNKLAFDKVMWSKIFTATATRHHHLEGYVVILNVTNGNLINSGLVSRDRYDKYPRPISFHDVFGNNDESAKELSSDLGL